MSKKDELWDIYDANRVKTGRLHRRGDNLKIGDYHLVIHVCIINSNNQILIQQRQSFRTLFANMWDI